MQPRVLVVDDDQAVRTVVSELLRGAGIDAHCACDGGEALEILHAGDVPDLLLLDLAMPNVDGWRVLAALDDHSPFRALPVIVLTSFATPPDLPERVPAVHKPIDPDLLLELIRARLPDHSPSRAQRYSERGITP